METTTRSALLIYTVVAAGINSGAFFVFSSVAMITTSFSRIYRQENPGRIGLIQPRAAAFTFNGGYANVESRTECVPRIATGRHSKGKVGDEARGAAGYGTTANGGATAGGTGSSVAGCFIYRPLRQ